MNKLIVITILLSLLIGACTPSKYKMRRAINKSLQYSLDDLINKK